MESFLQLFDPQNDKELRKRQWDDSENEGNGLSDCDTSSTDEDQEDRLPPEPEQGNIEYKLKLINPSSQRFEHLVTQMKWRLKEGHGEAIYQIGSYQIITTLLQFCITFFCLLIYHICRSRRQWKTGGFNKRGNESVLKDAERYGFQTGCYY